ncbi:restriction endonuclease subunit S [Segatella sp.]|uniref:restriction endonuclease subunit S n=1 Tax=Segatella sp. TaxID=2974253 RepID=UPI003AB93D56
MEDYVFSVTDGDHQAPPKVSKGIPFLVISNIADGSLDFSNTRYVPEEYYEKIPMERKPKRGDILFSVTGSYGIVVNIKTDRLFCFQRHIGLIKPTISNEYLSFVLMSNYIKSLCDKLATGTAQKTVGLDTLRSLYVPIAPIEEQEKIVAKIKHLLLQISFLEAGKGKLVAAIKQAKSKILDLAIHGKLVPQDPNDEPANELLKRINPKAEITCDNPQYGKLPKGWCETHIGDAFKVTMGQSPDGSSLNPIDGMEFHQGKILFGNKYLRKSSVLTNSPTKIADADTLLLCVRAPVGVVNITKQRICIGRGLCCLTPTKAINLDYAFYMLTTFQEKFESQSTGSTFKAISGSIIKNEQLWLPPLSEQHRIVAKIEELFAHLDKIEASL